jgi:hypothetical protein
MDCHLGWVQAFTLLIFLPFALLPYYLASSLYFFVVAGALILLIKTLRELLISLNLYNEGQYTFLQLFAVLLSGISHVVREVHLGNTNALLLLFLTLSIKNILNSKPKTGAFCLAFAVLCKPYFLILFLPLILHKKTKVLFYTCIFISLAMFIPTFFLGFSKDISLHLEWFKAMLAHDTYLESSHTLWSLIRFYFGFSLPPSIICSICLLLLMVYLLYFRFNNQGALNQQNPEIVKSQNLIIQYFLLIGIIPNIFTTDTEHFLFSLPLIAFLLFKVNRWTVSKISLVSPIIVFYGCNSTDFFGHKLSNLFEVWGLTGICNFIIIVLVACVFLLRPCKLNSNKNVIGGNS